MKDSIINFLQITSFHQSLVNVKMLLISPEPNTNVLPSVNNYLLAYCGQNFRFDSTFHVTKSKPKQRRKFTCKVSVNQKGDFLTRMSCKILTDPTPLEKSKSF